MYSGSSMVAYGTMRIARITTNSGFLPRNVYREKP
jgi:hypothetical protein